MEVAGTEEDSRVRPLGDLAAQCLVQHPRHLPLHLLARHLHRGRRPPASTFASASSEIDESKAPPISAAHGSGSLQVPEDVILRLLNVRRRMLHQPVFEALMKHVAGFLEPFEKDPEKRFNDWRLVDGMEVLMDPVTTKNRIQVEYFQQYVMMLLLVNDRLRRNREQLRETAAETFPRCTDSFWARIEPYAFWAVGDLRTAEQSLLEQLESIPSEESGRRLLCLNELGRLHRLHGHSNEAVAYQKRAISECTTATEQLAELLLHAYALNDGGEKEAAAESLAAATNAAKAQEFGENVQALWLAALIHIQNGDPKAAYDLFAQQPALLTAQYMPERKRILPWTIQIMLGKEEYLKDAARYPLLKGACISPMASGQQWPVLRPRWIFRIMPHFSRAFTKDSFRPSTRNGNAVQLVTNARGEWELKCEYPDMPLMDGNIFLRTHDGRLSTEHDALQTLAVTRYAPTVANLAWEIGSSFGCGNNSNKDDADATRAILVGSQLFIVPPEASPRETFGIDVMSLVDRQKIATAIADNLTQAFERCATASKQSLPPLKEEVKMLAEEDVKLNVITATTFAGNHILLLCSQHQSIRSSTMRSFAPPPTIELLRKNGLVREQDFWRYERYDIIALILRFDHQAQKLELVESPILTVQRTARPHNIYSTSALSWEVRVAGYDKHAVVELSGQTWLLTPTELGQPMVHCFGQPEEDIGPQGKLTILHIDQARPRLYAIQTNVADHPKSDNVLICIELLPNGEQRRSESPALTIDFVPEDERNLTRGEILRRLLEKRAPKDEGRIVSVARVDADHLIVGYGVSQATADLCFVVNNELEVVWAMQSKPVINTSRLVLAVGRDDWGTQAGRFILAVGSQFILADLERDATGTGSRVTVISRFDSEFAVRTHHMVAMKDSFVVTTKASGDERFGVVVRLSYTGQALACYPHAEGEIEVLLYSVRCDERALFVVDDHTNVICFQLA